MANKIGPYQTAHEWHPNVVLTWRKYVEEVVGLIIVEPHSLGEDGIVKWVIIIVISVDKDNRNPGSLSS